MATTKKALDLKETAKKAVSVPATNQKPYTLHTATQRIKELQRIVNKSMLDIACILYNVKKYELYKEKKYKSIFEYADKELGYKRASVYQAIKMAARYIEPASIENDKTKTIDLKEPYKGLTSSQLMELNSLPEDVAEKLAPSVKGLTKDETRIIVKEHKPTKVKKDTEKKPVKEVPEKKVFTLWSKAFEFVEYVPDNKKKDFGLAMRALRNELKSLDECGKL